MPPRVSSENTTPKPNVSSAALRSQTVISLRGASCLVSAAKYSPPGPPPTIAIRIPPPYRAEYTLCRFCDDRQENASSDPGECARLPLGAARLPAERVRNQVARPFHTFRGAKRGKSPWLLAGTCEKT